MKSDTFISNTDDIILTNENLTKKIKYLEAQKKKNERQIKDQQQSITKYQQSLASMATKNNNHALKLLVSENSNLHKKLNEFQEEYMTATAKLLIEEQFRNYQKKLYNDRIMQYENSMSDLRKYLKDKEDSFSATVGRLRQYEELQENKLGFKLREFNKKFDEYKMHNLIEQLTGERDRYKNLFEKFNIEMEDLNFLKECFENKQSYEKMKTSYLKIKLKKRSIVERPTFSIEKTKSTTNETFVHKTNSDPNSQLIRLLKKQKLSNQLLQQALNQAIQKNQQLIEEINSLAQSHKKLQLQNQRLQSRVILLEKQLSKNESQYLKRSKCDIDYPSRQWLESLRQQGDEKQIYLKSLRQDMDKISQFMLVCLPSIKMGRSSSSQNMEMRGEDELSKQNDYQIEQI